MWAQFLRCVHSKGLSQSILGCQVFFDLNTLLDAGVCATFETVKVRLEKQVMSVL